MVKRAKGAKTSKVSQSFDFTTQDSKNRLVRSYVGSSLVSQLDFGNRRVAEYENTLARQ